MRPFRFGVDLSAIVDGAELSTRARRAEAAGYDTIVLGDHLLGQLAPIPALAAIARQAFLKVGARPLAPGA